MKKPVTKSRKIIIFSVICLSLLVISMIFAVIASVFSDAVWIIFAITFGAFCFSLYIYIPYVLIVAAKSIAYKVINSYRTPQPKEKHLSSEYNSEKGALLYSRYKSKFETFKTKNGKAVTWNAVVALLVFFFPISLFYMTLKAEHEKSLYFENGIKMFVLGTALALFTFVPLVYFIYESAWILVVIPGCYLVMGIIFIILGIALKHKGKKTMTICVCFANTVLQG